MADGDNVTPFSPGGPPPGATPPPPTPGGAGGMPPRTPPGEPTGISPAAQDTGNQGAEMEARVAVNFLANRLTELAGRLGLGSELGNALHKAAGILARAVPKGSIPQGAEVAQIQRILQSQRQNAANLAAMRQQAGPPAGAGGAPGGMPAAPPPPRPPTMPAGMAA